MMKVCKVHMSEFSAPVDESMNLDQPLQQEMGGCAQLLQAAGNDSPDDSESYVFFCQIPNGINLFCSYIM